MVNWLIRKLDYLIATLNQKINDINEWFAYWSTVAEASPEDEKPTWGSAFKYTIGVLIGYSVALWRIILITIENTAIRLLLKLGGKL